MNENKKIYLEIMRIFAIFFVIYNHTSAYTLYSYDVGGTIKWCIHVCMSIFCRMAVPVFWMISGVLLLDKNEPVKVVRRKRIFRMAIILITVSSLYLLKQRYINGPGFDYISFFKKAYSSNVATYLWYLYSYIGFLMSLPLLRCMVKNMENKHFIYIFTIAVFFAIWHIIEYRLWQGELYINNSLKMEYLLKDPFIYPLLGYYIEKSMQVNAKKVSILGITSIISIVFQTYMTSYNAKLTGNSGIWIFCDFQYFIAAFIFLFLKWCYMHFENNVPNRIINVLIEIGACTFGVYLVHPLIYDTWLFEKIYEVINRFVIGRTLREIIYVIIIMMTSYLMVFYLRQIKILKKLL